VILSVKNPRGLPRGFFTWIVVVKPFILLSTSSTSIGAFCGIQASCDMKPHRGEIDINRFGHSKQILVDDVLKAIDD